MIDTKNYYTGLDIVILASGKSKRFRKSVPSVNLFNRSKLNSIIDKYTNDTVLSRLCNQLCSIPFSRVLLVCDPSIDSFDYINHSNLHRIYTHPESFNNCYSLSSYFKSVSLVPSTLVIVDADTFIPSDTFDLLGSTIDKLNFTTNKHNNFITLVDKDTCNKSDNEWSVKFSQPDNPFSVINKVLDDSKSNDNKVTAGITIFNDQRSIMRLYIYVLNKDNYNSYWDYFYYSDINYNYSEKYKGLCLGNIYELDNYSDYLLIKTLSELDHHQ